MSEDIETVYYFAPKDTIYVTHRDEGVFYVTLPTTWMDLKGDGKKIQIGNFLGLIRNRVIRKNWSWCMKKGYLIRLGRL